MRSEFLNTMLSTVALGTGGVALALVATAPPPTSDANSDAIKTLRVEQARLRKELERFQEVAPDPARPERRELPARTAQIQKLRAKAMDGTQMDILRLVAVSQLRGLGKGARCGDVARSMIALAQGTQDPKIRADIWRQMHRADDQQLIDPMIHALAHDTEPRVREEAAESLGFFLDVPRAKAALEHAMHNDSAKGVRRAAERSLEGKNR